MAAFGALLAVFPAAGDASENLFKNALRYTVQIKATVPIPFSGDRKGSGLGTGFLVDEKRGWIMTNAHVVSRSPSRVEVAFHGQEFAPATKVYVDPFLDLAIVKVDERVDTQALEVPPLECESLPRVGHPVGAFGHPWRLQFTGTRGIISGVAARYRTELLQTDASIEIRDAAEIGATGLMVHHVEAGSVGQSQEIRTSDLLEALDGAAVDDVDQLFDRLAQARDAGRSATFTFRRLTAGEVLFTYTQRRLPVTELRLIGPSPGAARAG